MKKECIAPLNIADPRYNDSRKRLKVGCGDCMYCLEQRRASWSIRLQFEERDSESSHFVTLTYKPEELPISPKSLLPEVRPDHADKYLKTLRYRSGENFKYYFVAEYSDVGRPHYHGIIFNASEDDIMDAWEYGHKHIGKVTPASIHYTTKYIINRRQPVPAETNKPFSRISNGLGASYAKRNKEWHTKQMLEYVVVNGINLPMPKYIQNKIFTNMDMKNDAVRERKDFHMKAEKDYEYMKEVERLRNLGYQYPEWMLEEAHRYYHEVMKQKSKK